MRVISGRRMAARMAIVSVVWLVLGLILALMYADMLFVLFGVTGAMGAGISSAVAIAGR